MTEYCASRAVSCLHAGLAKGFAEVIWNEVYRVPSPALDDVCDYPLARNLVLLTAAVAAEAILAFVATGEQRSFTLTLRDLIISPY